MPKCLLSAVSYLLLLNLIAYAQTPAVTAQTAAQQRLADQAGQLPQEYRERAQTLLTDASEIQRTRAATDLARRNNEAVIDFLIAVLETESSVRIRTAIVDTLGRSSTSAKVREMLERAATADADVGVSRVALERLRQQRTVEIRALLTKRTQLAREKNDEAGLRLLAEEQERWISLVRGTMLPAFLRKPPELFSLKPETAPVRVLAFGDFGTGSKSQKDTAAAMLAYHKKSPFDFGITLGDNFYNVGMESPQDARWKTWWEDMYGEMKIKFYASLGNHDWGSADSPAAEILYSSATWKMPATYYTFTAGPAQFFALDTNEVSDAQLMWLQGELSKSRARWKIVYGHHPIYSDGDHGDSLVLRARLLPLLKDKVDVYLVGHDHVLNHIKPENGVHFFVAGGAGAGLYKITPKERTLFAESKNGFAVVEADEKSLTVRFIGMDSKLMYEHTLRKDGVQGAR